MIVDGVQAVVGLGLLVVASDRMVRSTIRVSNALGVSAILIGAVIVGFGTSVPEFLVSGLASLEGNLDLAMSNVTSSNAANVTLVLGVAAVISPVAARRTGRRPATAGDGRRRGRRRARRRRRS